VNLSKSNISLISSAIEYYDEIAASKKKSTITKKLADDLTDKLIL
jgi:hypothetical protein